MDKKRICRSKKQEDSCKNSESDKSVTGLYYGKISNLINKKKIKCLYEPLDDYQESTGSLVENEPNLASELSMEVKIFKDGSFFEQDDLTKGCIEPSTGSGKQENLGIAIGVQISPKENSEDLKVVVEFDVVGRSTTSLTESKQYTSRMKLSEETPSKMIFNGILNLQPRVGPLRLIDIPLYIIDSKEKIVENPGFGVSYKTSAKSRDRLDVNKPMEVLVKLKVDKPTGTKREERKESSARKENKECCCNKQDTKKTTFSDILMCRRKKSQDCDVQDQKTETIGSADAATQSNVNLQSSKSNQTASQVSVSSGRDVESKSNQTNAVEEAKSETDNRKSAVSIKEPLNSTVSVHRLQVVDDNKFKFNVQPSPSETRKSDVDIELTRTESKHQRKRREGWDRLERKRSKDDAKLTAHNTNSTLRNAATQSSANRITANKEISVQYSFISPTFGIFAENDLGASSSTLTDSLVPVKSAPFGQFYPKSIESTSTQWPQSLTSSDNHSQTLTLVSDVLDNEIGENNPIVVENPQEKKKFSYDGSYGFSQENPQVMNVTFATQTDLFQKPDMINTYCQYMQYPVEDEILSLNLESNKNVDYNFKESHKTLDLLERAKFKLGEYAEKYYYPYTPKSISNIQVDDVSSIPQSEEGEEDGSFPKHIDKEIDASQCAVGVVKKQNVFARFINHLKPVTVAQYHTICSTSNPFQLKSIPSLSDNQNSAKLELELQTLEIDKVNSKLSEEIDSLQKIYENLNTSVSFIFENTDILTVPPPIQKEDSERGSIEHIDSDVSMTFVELKSCLSTIDKILSTASSKSIYETPPSTASSSREDTALHEDVVSHEIHTTYTTVENDIKKTIKELLKESEYIKHQALLNGAPEEPEPPFFFEYIDLLKEPNPLLICKSIVDDLSSKTSNTKEQEKKCESDEKSKKYRQEDKSKKSIGSCSRIKTDGEENGKKDLKLKVDNKKNDRITYFCTTFVSKVPKTSFSFGGNSRALHREKRIQKKENVTDNTTSGDNVKVREENNVELSKTCINIMEPNLTTKNLISINGKSDLESLNLKEEVNTQKYEKNLSYSNYIAYLNGTDCTNDSERDTKNIEEIQKEPSNVSDLLAGVINNEVNILQVQESVLTNSSSTVGSEKSSEIGLANSIKPADQKKSIPPKPGMILKSPKSFLLAENFNKMNMPSTSATFYKPIETTDEEQVICDMDLTRENRQEATVIISDEPLGAKAEQSKKLPPEPHHQRFHSIRNIPATSSEEFVFQRHPPKHMKRPKDFKTIKPKIETIIDSDSDETLVKIMRNNCQENAQTFSESSGVFLKSTRANTNVCLQHSSKSMLAASTSGVSSKENSILSFENGFKDNSNESDYDGDYETDQIATSIPVRVYKSKQQLNSPEEIERIEENVRQNDMLERRNLHVFLQPVSTLSICDDYSPVFARTLVSEYSLSDSSPEIYSSDKN